MRLDPLAIFLEVVRSMLGWAIAVFMTVVVGHWLGMCLGYGRLCGVNESLVSLPWYVVLWIVFPQLLIAYGVTALSWYLPIRFEGAWLKIGAAAANLLAWTVAVAWVCRHTPW